MLGSSLLALLIIKARKWYLLRKSFKPELQTPSKGRTLEQYIEQVDSVRYVDEWPPTERVLEVGCESKAPSTT